MTETNAKIHVLADETLGGIKREYVEVDRKAGVGEKIVITSSNYEEYEEIYVAGHYGKVIEKSDWPRHVLKVDFNGFDNGFVGDDGIWSVGNDPSTDYRTLEGVKDFGFVLGTEYRVLVPVESAEDEPKPADPIDVIASLAQEVAELKRKVSDLETTVERHERVNDRHRDEIDTLYKDKRTLGEELARLKYPAKNESIIESAPFVLVIHGGQGEFDVYQRGKKIENISRLEIEADSRIGSSIDLQFDDVGVRP